MKKSEPGCCSFIRAPILKIIEASFGNNLYKLILDFPIHKLRTLQGLLTHT